MELEELYRRLELNKKKGIDVVIYQLMLDFSKNINWLCYGRFLLQNRL